MSHSHDHTHEHGHDHGHDHDDYFLDQLCLIAISGAFGAVCLTMYFWKTPYLTRILAPQFYNFVLWSGVALMVMFLVRAVALWREAGESNSPAAHDHTHEHGHEHPHHDHEHSHEGHEHFHHEHDHDHDHEHCHHEHGHEHPHEHTHSHHSQGHSHDHGHDHKFAPWRYVILVVPIVLFLLDLPRPKRPKEIQTVDLSQEARVYGEIAAAGFSPLTQMVFASQIYWDEIKPSEINVMEFKELSQTAFLPQTREFWKGKAVEVIGEVPQNSASDRIFTLVRFRIQCCGADLQHVRIGVVCKEPVQGLDQGGWYKVVGRVEFQKTPDGQNFVTVLRVPQSKWVQSVPTPADPYIQ